MFRGREKAFVFGSGSLYVMRRVRSVLADNVSDLGVRKHVGATLCITAITEACHGTVSSYVRDPRGCRTGVP